MDNAQKKVSQNLLDELDSTGIDVQEQATGGCDSPRLSPTSDLQDQELRRNGFEACELVVGIDFTKSNTWTGRNSFEGKCLHDIRDGDNPYMKALRFVAERLSHLDDDCLIPCYGFGDDRTGGNAVFSFMPDNEPIIGLQEVLKRYKKILPHLVFSGPTSFAPLIRQAMCTVYGSRMKFHLLLILADGQISEEYMEETKDAIIEATHFPLSIVAIGVGDGPWDAMVEFDNELPKREWDNFHFFELNRISTDNLDGSDNKTEGERFKANVTKELLDHYKHARNMMGEDNMRTVQCIINTIPFTNLIGPPDDS